MRSKGALGEALAEAFLREKGYEILARNYRTRQGEIDLIARQGSYVIFVEVKYRTGLAYGYPREAVGPAKRRRLLLCAQAYAAAMQLTDTDFRFDVIEILDQEGLGVEHIENAF
jgi:putative endonuclease